jgi:hypothetical protein
MCIPPQWENRRAQIAQLEPIRTVEAVVGDTGAEAAPTRRGAD